MLRVEVKGTGGQKRYRFDEDVIVGSDGSLVGESGDQTGRLLATAGRVLTVAEAEALGVAALLDAAIKSGNVKAKKVEAEAKAEPPSRKRGRRKAKK
jgi:hypothetical protein